MNRAYWAFVVSAALALLMLLPEWLLAAEFTLDQALAHALANNKDLAADREGPESADARVDRARSAMLPHLKLTGGYQYQSEVPEIEIARPDITLPPGGVGMPTIDTITETRAMGAHDNWRAEARVDQLLFASGGVHAAIKAARAGETATAEQVLAAEQDLARRVREAFYTVLFAQEMLAARKESLDVAEAHLADVKVREAQGAASRFEVLRSEIEVGNLRPDVEQAANQVLIAKTGLKSLLGLDLDASIDLAGSLDAPAAPPAYDVARDEAMAGRHELLALNAAADAQSRLAWSATSGMLPRLAANAAYTYQKPWYFEDDWADVWTVGVGLEIPIFDGADSLAARREALSEKRRAEREKAAAAEAIDLTIRRALLDLSEIEKRRTETAGNVQRAQDSLAMAETGYREGAMTNLEVLDAQLALTGARTRHIQAQYDYQIAVTRLLAASGRPLGE